MSPDEQFKSVYMVSTYFDDIEEVFNQHQQKTSSLQEIYTFDPIDS